MTGFGRAEKTIGDKTYQVDVKALNGKQFELQLKIPAFLRPYEFDIRRVLSEELLRGSVDCMISLKDTGNAKPVTINTQLARAYYKPLAELSEELNLDASNILSSLLKLPEVITPSSDTLSDDEWSKFSEVLREAIHALDQHRLNEGEALKQDLANRIANISRYQKDVNELEPRRKQKIRDGLKKLLEDNVGPDQYDANRLEQELIYYIEKIDISEEQVRLSNHCEYFNSLLNDKDVSKGKKLSFILQEIGREINTTGSKAYDSTIQQVVVLMKDELEKAKEQILNVL
jgi:uncharacterized protein (TIGR00255 family)